MNFDINIMEIFKSSFTLAILAIASIIFVTFAIERWLYFRKIKIDIVAFAEALRGLLEIKNFDEAVKVCDKTPGPVSAIARAAILNRARPKNQIEDLVSAVRIEERLKIENYLGILGTLGNTAPFIGLFGTVVGIIKAFHDLALSGSGGPSVVAAGISEALVATAGGLAVAIPSVMCYNYFLRQVKNLSIAMEATQKRISVYLE